MKQKDIKKKPLKELNKLIKKKNRKKINLRN
jgi:hypothetical protein